MSELRIKGMGIAQDVVATIVTLAAESVEGVAHVGENVITSSLISVFSSTPIQNEVAVESEVVDDKLKITVHLAVFFGYQFKDLADQCRQAIAEAVLAQIGVEVAEVNICIDSLVFPKE